MKISFRHARLLFFIAVALCASASTAKADTVLYTDGPTSDYQGRLLIGPFEEGNFDVEDSFTLSSDSTLTSITFGGVAELLGTYPTSVQWAIVSSEGSQTPVCVSCSGTSSLAGTYDFAAFNGFLYDETFSLPDINLSAGTYWLEFLDMPTNNFMTAAWEVNDGPSMVWDSYTGDLTGSNCETTGIGPGAGDCSNAFTIYGTSSPSATPEPSSLALLGSGALLLGAEIRRRCRTIR